MLPDRRLPWLLAAFVPAMACAAAADTPAWQRALQQEDYVAIARLAPRGVDLEFLLPDGKSALMIAAKAGDRSLVEVLLAAGARPDARNPRGGTALMYAAHGGKSECVQALLDAGADVNARANNGWTALMLAAAKDHVDVAALLLQRDADANLADIYGWTPLMRAVYAGHHAVADALLRAGRVVLDAREESGATALHLAAIQRDPAAARLLLVAGADPGARDGAGRTPLDLARTLQDQVLIELLAPGPRARAR